MKNGNLVSAGWALPGGTTGSGGRALGGAGTPGINGGPNGGIPEGGRGGKPGIIGGIPEIQDEFPKYKKDWQNWQFLSEYIKLFLFAIWRFTDIIESYQTL